MKYFQNGICFIIVMLALSSCSIEKNPFDDYAIYTGFNIDNLTTQDNENCQKMFKNITKLDDKASYRCVPFKHKFQKNTEDDNKIYGLIEVVYWKNGKSTYERTGKVMLYFCNPEKDSFECSPNLGSNYPDKYTEDDFDKSRAEIVAMEMMAEKLASEKEKNIVK